MDYNALKALYCALCLPYLTYSVAILGNNHPTNLNALSLLQKRAIRAICKTSRHLHTEPLFSRMRILKLHDLVQLRTPIFMHEVYLDMPQNLLSLFHYNDRQSGQACTAIMISISAEQISCNFSCWCEILEEFQNSEKFHACHPSSGELRTNCLQDTSAPPNLNF